MSTPDPGGALVFAYGSNMLRRRIRSRAPSALSVGPAELRGFRLAFHKHGADGSGKADVVRADPDDRVHGVLYRVAREELDTLDGFEGGYARETLHVISAGGYSVEAVTYRARDDQVRPDVLPFSWYLALVAAGAREHRLPAHHVLWIETHPHLPDPDAGRHAEAMRLLAPEG